MGIYQSGLCYHANFNLLTLEVLMNDESKFLVYICLH